MRVSSSVSGCGTVLLGAGIGGDRLGLTFPWSYWSCLRHHAALDIIADFALAWLYVLLALRCDSQTRMGIDSLWLVRLVSKKLGTVCPLV